MKRAYLLLGLLVLAGLVYFLVNRDSFDDNQIACTADALICPDGSGVGRTGPDCEFAACPNQEAFEGELKQQGRDFVLVIKAPEDIPGETTYALPLSFSRVSNVIGTLINKEVRVAGKFRKGNLLEVEFIDELADADMVTLAVGATAFKSGLLITLNKILEDSRCPIDAVCIQAGRLLAELVLKSNTEEATYTIGTDKPALKFDVYTISLEAISPIPNSQESMESRRYVLTFKVSK